jgi:hypothetical protein
MNILKKLKSRLSKGQAFVLQFLMFFLIGLMLFISLGNFYKYESQNIRNQLRELSVEMINSYMSSLVVSSVGGCSDCGVVEHKLKLRRTYAGNFIEMDLDYDGLLVKTAPTGAEFLSSMNNLNSSLDITQSSASSIKTINLTYDKNQNKLEIT